jgi:hypothetical protein
MTEKTGTDILRWLDSCDHCPHTPSCRALSWCHRVETLHKAVRSPGKHSPEKRQRPDTPVGGFTNFERNDCDILALAASTAPGCRSYSCLKTAKERIAIP